MVFEAQDAKKSSGNSIGVFINESSHVTFQNVTVPGTGDKGGDPLSGTSDGITPPVTEMSRSND